MARQRDRLSLLLLEVGIRCRVSRGPASRDCVWRFVLSPCSCLKSRRLQSGEDIAFVRPYHGSTTEVKSIDSRAKWSAPLPLRPLQQRECFLRHANRFSALVIPSSSIAASSPSPSVRPTVGPSASVRGGKFEGRKCGLTPSMPELAAEGN